MVGLGKIGSEIAKRLEAFGCIISYIARKEKPWLSYHYFSDVRDLAADSNVLVVCCALNSETHHIIHKDVMHALGKEGFVVNIGRGALIDEKELVRCLTRGEIAGAGLDVFETEPNVPEELFNLDNVVLSSHKAVFTKEAIEDLGEFAANNLEAFFANKPLLSPVI